MKADEISPSHLSRTRARGYGWALTAGIAVGLVAAAVAWYAIPPRSTALIRLRFPDRQWMDQQGAGPYQSWLSSRRGQADSITNESVLAAVFEEPGIPRLSGVAEAADPIVWLRERIQAGFAKDSDILQVIVAGDAQDDVLKLAEALKKAYLGTFLSRQRETRLNHKKEPKKGPGLICAKHPPGRSGKLNLVPFSAQRQRRFRAESALRGRVDSLRDEVGKLDEEIGQLKAQLAKVGERKSSADKTQEQVLIERYLQAALADDPAIARGRSLAIALDAAHYEERLRAVRPDQPSVGRLEDRLEAVRNRTARRREEIRPDVFHRLEKQIARGEIPTPPASIQTRIKQHEQQKVMLEKELALATSMLDERTSKEQTPRAREKEQAAGRTGIGRLEADATEVDSELGHLDTELAALERIARWNKNGTPLLSSNADDRCLQVVLAGLAALLATAALVLQWTRRE